MHVPRFLLALPFLAPLAACDNDITPLGQLTPNVSGPTQAEMDSIALPGGPATQAACGDGRADDVAEVFFTRGNNWVYHGPSDQLGNAGAMSSVNLPLPSNNTISCGFGSGLEYKSLTDSVLGVTNDGVVVEVGLGFHNFCDEGPLVPFYATTRSLFVRTSDDCGATFDVTSVIDATDLVMPGGESLDVVFFDRQELYIDAENGTAYISVRVAETLKGLTSHTVILRSDDLVDWDVVARLPWSNVTAMNSITVDDDDRLVLFRCLGEASDSGAVPNIAVLENPDTTVYDVEAGDVVDQPIPGAPTCAIISDSDDTITLNDYANRVEQVHVGPIDWGYMVPTQVRVSYPGVNGDYQTAHVLDVEIEGAPGIVDSRTLDASADYAHVLWADLQGTEGRTDHNDDNDLFAQVLHWTQLNDGYSSVAHEFIDSWRPIGGWAGEQSVDDHTIQSTAVPPSTTGPDRFLGDYKSGTFIDQVPGQQMRFFVIWSTTSGFSAPNVYAEAAYVVP